MSKREQKAVRELQKDNNIIIQNADKGGAVCVMNTEFYAHKMEELLNDTNTYAEIDTNHLRQPKQ